MSKMSELSMIADEIMEYDSRVWDKLGMRSWPSLNLPKQRRYYSEFMAHVDSACRDYFELTWPEQEIVRDRLTDENYHSAVLCLSLFKDVCSYDLSR